MNDKNKEPTKEKNDKQVDSPLGGITLPMVGKDRFENDEVYVALYSLTGCTVTMTVQFPELKTGHFSRRTVREDYADEADFEDYLVCKKFRKENRHRLANKDCFVREHVLNVGDFPIMQARRNQMNAEKRKLLKEQSQQRRKEDMERDRRFKFHMLRKWDYIRDHRDREYEEARQKKAVKERNTQFIKLGQTYLLLRDLFTKFAEHREAIRLHEKKMNNSVRIQKRYALFRKRVSATIAARTKAQILSIPNFEKNIMRQQGINEMVLRQARDSLMAMNITQIDLIRRRAQGSLYSFLESTSNNYTITTKFLRFKYLVDTYLKGRFKEQI